MKNNFLVAAFLLMLGLVPSVMAQSTDQIDKEQQELRAQQLYLQRKKDSLSKVNTDLQNKLAAEQLLIQQQAKLKHHNAIGFDPVASLFYLGASFTYERAIAKKQSLRLSLTFYDYEGANQYIENNQHSYYLRASMGYRCLLEYRIYLLKHKRVFDGFYAGPLVMYKQRVEEVSEKSKYFNTYYYSSIDQPRTRFGSALGFGAVVGYAIPMGKRFVFDAYVHIGGTVGLGDRDDALLMGRPLVDTYNSSTFLGTGITMGYKF